MRRVILSFSMALAAVGVRGQFAGWEVAAPAAQGRAPMRTELVSYTTRQDADTGDPAKAFYYSEIRLSQVAPGVYTGAVDLPFMWRGQRVYLRVEGLPQFTARVNDTDEGMSQDSRVMSEFVVTDAVLEGRNTVTITSIGGPGSSSGPGAPGAQLETIPGATAPAVRAVLMAQPTVGIEDYTIQTDAGGKAGRFTLDVALVNSTGGEASFGVGYDIYSPDNKLIEYNVLPVTIKAFGRDTLRFETPIPGAGATLWSAASPKLYHGMIYIKQDGHNTEYVTYVAAFGMTDFIPSATAATASAGSEGGPASRGLTTASTLAGPSFAPASPSAPGAIRRNGQNIMAMRAAKFNVDDMKLTPLAKVATTRTAAAQSAKTKAAATQTAGPQISAAQAVAARIAALRKSGVGVLCVDYPQPVWFYDICDRVGMYVVDQANINAGTRAADRSIGGAAANDPRLVDFFTDRVRAEYRRVGGHPCIVAWSLGGESGTGYNMYEAYLALKALDSSRAVLYRGAQGGWNNDISFAFPH